MHYTTLFAGYKLAILSFFSLRNFSCLIHIRSFFLLIFGQNIVSWLSFCVNLNGTGLLLQTLGRTLALARFLKLRAQLMHWKLKLWYLMTSYQLGKGPFLSSVPFMLSKRILLVKTNFFHTIIYWGSLSSELTKSRQWTENNILIFLAGFDLRWLDLEPFRTRLLWSFFLKICFPV